MVALANNNCSFSSCSYDLPYSSMTLYSNSFNKSESYCWLSVSYAERNFCSQIGYGGYE